MNVRTREEIEEIVRGIEPADKGFLRQALERQNQLTKPPGSLGRLEEIANRLCAMERTLAPAVDDPVIFIFAADHGVCEEGVNSYPQAVTRQMVANFLAGGAAINALAEVAGARLTVVDVGVAGAPIDDLRLLSRRVAPGTRNLCREAAMSIDEAVSAIAIGVECALDAINRGARMLGIGEMGIGNTTAASALCAALTHASAEAVCGRGTGLDDAGLRRKRDVVQRALALHGEHSGTGLETTARLGGFEIAAMCGVCLGAARHRTPVIMDGFISTAAAALAVVMNGAVADYLIASHESSEPGHRALLDLLRLQPLLQLNMRLGEGTGAALAMPLIRAAVAAFRSMATFDSAGVAGSSATSS